MGKQSGFLLRQQEREGLALQVGIRIGVQYAIDTLNEPKDLATYGWAANPWVWVIEFERISREEAKGK